MTGNEIDVLVVGEGLSGICAAATAAGQGSRVMLVSKGPGSFVLGTGAIDLDGFDAVVRAGYGDHAEEAFEFFAALFAAAGCSYRGDPRSRCLVPTILGTFQSVSMAPRSLWEGDPRCHQKVVVAGIDSLSGFDADFVAQRLSAHTTQMGLNTTYRSVTVRLPDRGRHVVTPMEVASQVDRDADYRSALLEALRSIAQDAELLILPGILGTKSADDDISNFETVIGCPVCELATMPPSVPGLRLSQRLEARLLELGVELCTGFAVQQLCLEDDRCTGIVLDTPGRPRRILADTIVLACGRFSQLLQASSPQETSLRSYQVNEKLRPVNSEGLVVAQNLFQCRSILQGSKPEHAAAIAILTGYRTGMLASKQGVSYATR